jgi:hypothetical protein
MRLEFAAYLLRRPHLTCTGPAAAGRTHEHLQTISDREGGYRHAEVIYLMRLVKDSDAGDDGPVAQSRGHPHRWQKSTAGPSLATQTSSMRVHAQAHCSMWLSTRRPKSPPRGWSHDYAEAEEGERSCRSSTSAVPQGDSSRGVRVRNSRVAGPAGQQRLCQGVCLVKTVAGSKARGTISRTCHPHRL